MRTDYTVFDIETAPAPVGELVAVMPEFTAPANYKDADKIARSIEEQKSKWIADAALSPLTGRIVCIGCMAPGNTTSILEGTEQDVLKSFFDMIRFGSMGANGRFVGFNCHSFDLPFIVKRAWKHGLDIPALRQGRYWANWIVDLREIWQMGDRMAAGSLGVIAQFMGLGKKSGDGAEFAKLYYDTSTHEQALDYLRNDLKLTKAIAQRIMDL
jgi:predicted PolB exonuclease-like 3'-5' exonuclease